MLQASVVVAASRRKTQGESSRSQLAQLGTFARLSTCWKIYGNYSCLYWHFKFILSGVLGCKLESRLRCTRKQLWSKARPTWKNQWEELPWAVTAQLCFDVQSPGRVACKTPAESWQKQQAPEQAASSSTGHPLLLVPWSTCRRTARGMRCIMCAATRIWSNDHRATTTQQLAVSLPSALSLSLSLHAFFTDRWRIWSGQINSWNFLLKSLSPCPWNSKPSTS